MSRNLYGEYYYYYYYYTHTERERERKRERERDSVQFFISINSLAKRLRPRNEALPLRLDTRRI